MKAGALVRFVFRHLCWLEQKAASIFTNSYDKVTNSRWETSKCILINHFFNCYYNDKNSHVSLSYSLDSNQDNLFLVGRVGLNVNWLSEDKLIKVYFISVSCLHLSECQWIWFYKGILCHFQYNLCLQSIRDASYQRIKIPLFPAENLGKINIETRRAIVLTCGNWNNKYCLNIKDW